MFITTQPAEQPGTGGYLESPAVQHPHPWIKNALLPHIFPDTAYNSKEQGLTLVPCITFVHLASLYVPAGRGPVFLTHYIAGFKRPLPAPL